MFFIYNSCILIGMHTWYFEWLCQYVVWINQSRGFLAWFIEMCFNASSRTSNSVCMGVIMWHQTYLFFIIFCLIFSIFLSFFAIILWIILNIIFWCVGLIWWGDEEISRPNKLKTEDYIRKSSRYLNGLKLLK